MNKKLVCRFTNKDNMEKFIKKIGMEGITSLTKEINFENNTHKERKIVNRKPATEKEWERSSPQYIPTFQSRIFYFKGVFLYE